MPNQRNQAISNHDAFSHNPNMLPVDAVNTPNVHPNFNHSAIPPYSYNAGDYYNNDSQGYAPMQTKGVVIGDKNVYNQS